MIRRSRKALLLAAAAALLGACGDDGASGTGTLTVVVEAEDAIVEGIPARAMGGGEGFSDGWSLTYQHLYVNVGQVALADAAGNRVAVPMDAAGGSRIYDLARGTTQEFFTVGGVPARRYDRVSYRSAPVDASAGLGPGVTADVRTTMAGASTWLQATATKGGRTIRLDWRFREGWQYSECQGPETRPGAGFVVASGGTTTLRLSLHGDHWYWQTLGQEGSPTRFDPIANADTMAAPYRGNGDNAVTLEELDLVNLADVPTVDGVFNPAGRPVTTLGAYMRASTGTNGHIDGDGVCSSRALP